MNEDVNKKESKKVDYDPTKINVGSKQLKELPFAFFQFFKKLISIDDEVSPKKTISSIIAEIEFKVDEEGKTEKQIADELEELKLKDNKWQFEAMQLKATGKRVSGQ